MSNQGLSRVVQIQDPTTYFRKLGRWFNEGFWQQSRGGNSYNVNVRSDMPRSTERSQWVPASQSSEGYQSTSQYYRRQEGARQRPGRVHLSHTVPDWNLSFRRLRWKKESLRWLSAVSRRGSRTVGSAISVVEAW